MKKKIQLTTTHIIMLSFLSLIIVGSLLLKLPISSATGKAIPYLDALFTATTATCVTGLVTLPIADTFSTFGHIVILGLIQVGGLGVITILSGVMISLNRRIGMKERVLLQDAFNLNTISGVVSFTKKVIKGTLVVEGVGALLYMTVLVPEYGLRGIWMSIFNAISAFCNAGMDIISDNSLIDYVLNPMVNLTTILLIILSGIGFIVWWDLLRVVKYFGRDKFGCFRRLTLHSKIALFMTGLLILVGTVLIFLFEYRNPLTIGDYSLGQKLEVALFQSVTTRTAGFATVPQENLTNPSAIVCLLLMFIGGSPVGTAGGVKTVTVVVLVTSMAATFRNRDEVVLFGRSVPKSAVNKAVAVTSTSFLILFLSTVFLSAVTDADVLDVVYETVSATATVGLSRNLTGALNDLGKVVIIVTMYLGRISPITLVVAFTTSRAKHNTIKYPTEEISVG